MVLAVVVELARVGAGVSGPELAGSWQLLDREVLAHDLLPGIWYLHTQPPLHNLVVGLALSRRCPAEGTLFVLYAGCLVGIGLIVHDLARRWGAPGPVAVVVAGLAVADPPLLGTIRPVGYEVPVALMVVGLVALVDRHVAAPPGPPRPRDRRARDGDRADAAPSSIPCGWPWCCSSSSSPDRSAAGC